MFQWSQGLTLTQNMERDFLLSTTFPTNGVITQPHYICLLKVLRPVRRPITTLNSNQALVARSGPEINSQACLHVLQGPRHNTKCWFSIQHFTFPLIFCLETPKKGSGPTNHWTEMSLVRLSAISFPRTPACPGTQYRPHSVPGRDIF